MRAGALFRRTLAAWTTDERRPVECPDPTMATTRTPRLLECW
jgi:hypothetical protein